MQISVNTKLLNRNGKKQVPLILQSLWNRIAYVEYFEKPFRAHTHLERGLTEPKLRKTVYKVEATSEGWGGAGVAERKTI